MMAEMPRHQVWEEPLVGQLFGEFHATARPADLNRPGFIMADATRNEWVKSVRSFVLDGAGYVRPLLHPDDYLVVKEPNGSVGAPLLMEALPESRMVLLVRDPRDVVASALDATRKGGWLYHRAVDEDPDAFVRRRAGVYALHLGSATEAYDTHEGPKSLVLYEELRGDTLPTIGRLYSDLRIPVEKNCLRRAVEKNAWEKLPEERKGSGKALRRATPGRWREDLTPAQARVVERATLHLLERFYP
jgi:hypothetical protein